MKIRKKSRGEKNITGKRIEEIRKKQGLDQKTFIARLQTNGLDINPSSYSKLEGQTRKITDIELHIIAKSLNVDETDFFRNK